MKWIFAVLAAGLLAGCGQDLIQDPAKGTPVAYAVNYPLAYFAERIAGDHMEVVFPKMEGDPAFWEPTPDQVVRFQNADLILLNGADYAKWVPKVSLPQGKMLDPSRTYAAQLIALDGAVNHTHGPGGAHAHGDLAFTTWLDPELAKYTITSLTHAFSAGLPEAKAELLANSEALVKDLMEIDASQQVAFTKLQGQPIVGSHPVYQYLARAHDLDMQSVHWEPDAEPNEQQWRELEDILEGHDAKIMLWEGEPLPATKAKLAERGMQSIVFDPCGNRPDSGDYLDVMKQNIAHIEAVRKESGSGERNGPP